MDFGSRRGRISTCAKYKWSAKCNKVQQMKRDGNRSELSLSEQSLHPSNISVSFTCISPLTFIIIQQTWIYHPIRLLFRTAICACVCWRQKDIHYSSHSVTITRCTLASFADKGVQRSGLGRPGTTIMQVQRKEINNERAKAGRGLGSNAVDLRAALLWAYWQAEIKFGYNPKLGARRWHL